MPRAIRNRRYDRPQNWRTPRALFLELELRFGRGEFTLDAAADSTNAQCAAYYDAETDGLKAPWWGRVFVNPPWNDVAPWVARAAAEMIAGTVEVVVLLLPARTDTTWFHQTVRPFASRIELIEGRIAYEDPTGGKRAAPPEGSMVVVFERPLRAADFRRAG